MRQNGWCYSPTCIRWIVVWIASVLPISSAWAETETEYDIMRREMVRDLYVYAQLAGSESGRAELDANVMTTLGQVPRHKFVPEDQRKYAYENRPLPIGMGQTISQPYIVALMTDLLEVDEDDIALEIGTGSGYQAAILAELVEHVYTIEIVEQLGVAATSRLKELGYDNVTTRIGDGYYGWKEHAPFDVIIVTAAANSIPPPLIRQLKPGGQMVIPVGSAFFTQQLLLVVKDEDGTVTSQQILPVRFVPLRRAPK